MWTTSYDIIVETLTGSEFEVTVNDRDTVGYLKAEIQKYEGIPVSQQHLLYRHEELTDGMEMKDIPLVKGSRVKLVLGMKGGPISSKRLFTISSDYDNWLDMSDVFSGDDLINLQSPGLKLLLYKDNKKNVHRLMKVRAEKAGDGLKGGSSSSLSRSALGSAGQGSGGHVSQKEREAAITKKKMDQIKAKLSMKKKRLGAVAQGGGENANDGGDENAAANAKEEEEGELLVTSGAGSVEREAKLLRSQSQYRHKKRHSHPHYQHHPHHQHETVIKEEKTPIGYRAATATAAGSSAVGGSPRVVGAIGSMLPAAAASAATAGAHRKSMPAVIDIGRQEQEPAVPPFSYGLVNVLHGSTTTTTGRTPTLELEKRSQIREHLQRNRSFKTILDFTRDDPLVGGRGGGSTTRTTGAGGGGLERSLSFHSNGILNRMNSETTLDGGIGIGRRCPNGRGGQSRLGGGGGATTTASTTTTSMQSLHQLNEKVSSASLHDLIELLKYTHSKQQQQQQQQRTISTDSLHKLMNYSKKKVVYMPQLYQQAGAGGAKKSSTLPDSNQSLQDIDEYLPDFDIGAVREGHRGIVGTERAAGEAGAIPKPAAAVLLPTSSATATERKIASAELAFKSAGMAGGCGGAVDKTYRTLCKSISDDSSVYELPKLLVREDSPVESSFLGSYSQLETVALRGDSPKNNFTSTSSSLQELGGCGVGGAGRLLEEPGSTATAVMSESLLELRPKLAPTTTTTTSSSSSGSGSSLIGEVKRASESLLQLAAIAVENVKSATAAPTTPPAANEPPAGSKLPAGGAAVDGAAGFIGDMGTTSLSSSSSFMYWYNWNQKMMRRQDASWSSLHQLNGAGGGATASNARHHHSDLGINELELKFVNAEAELGGSGGDGRESVIKLPAIPNLEAVGHTTSSNWLSSGCWDTIHYGRDEEEDEHEEEEDEEEDDDEALEVHEHDEEEEEEEEDDEDEEEDRVTSSSCSSIQRPHHRATTSNSTSFIHSHLSISSDEDDLLGVAHELGGGNAGPCGGGGVGGRGGAGGAYKRTGSNKSKSIDLNEFRKTFGSSPTLLNGGGFGAGVGTSCTRLVPQLSRLETIPSQYRRGYTNLNDACLSSSTSELECVSSSGAMGKSKHHHRHHSHNNHNVGLLPPPVDDRNLAMLKYRKGGSQVPPYVRSNEHLNHRYGKKSLLNDDEDGGEDLGGGGGDALYLRRRRHPEKSANRGDATMEEKPAELEPRCFGLRTDVEYRFSKLSCCSSQGGGGGSSSKPATSARPSAERNHWMLFGDERRASASKGSESAPAAAATTTTTTTPLRPSDYYFPSDESLFNMDSFFDDFVEIDTSDIFDSADFINLNAARRPAGRSKPHRASHGSLLLPDIQQQGQQGQGQQQSQSQYEADEWKQKLLPPYLYLSSASAKNQAKGEKDHRAGVVRTPPPVGLREASLDSLAHYHSRGCSTRSLRGRSGAALVGGNILDDEEDDEDEEEDDEDEDDVDDIDDDEEDDDDDEDEDEDDDDDDEGIASIIRHIDREKLCDEPRHRAASSSASAAAAAALSSSSIVMVHHNNGKRHTASSSAGRVLRLKNGPMSFVTHRSSSATAGALPTPSLPGALAVDCGGDIRGPSAKAAAAAAAVTTTTASTEAEGATAPANGEPAKAKKPRCAECNKKLGMVMVMKCHCERVFCAQHRYAEAHNCSYDFKLEGRKVLEKNNPLVVAEKLPKI